MRSTVKMIAAAAFAVVLTPASYLFAGDAARQPAPAEATAIFGAPTLPPHGPVSPYPLLAGLSASPSHASPAAAFAALALPGLHSPIPRAQMAASMPYSADPGNYTPRFELFLGYSYLRAVPGLTAGNRIVWLNGGSTSLALNLNHYLGVVADFGGFKNTEVRLGGNPSSTVDASGTIFTYLAGPRLSYRKHQRITPFVQALFGGIHASEVTASSGCAGPGCNVLPSETSFAFTAGGGLDLTLRQHLALRLIQAEYLMTRFNDLTTGKAAPQNDMRLSAGIVFRFGGHPDLLPSPPMLLTYSCSVNPSAVFPGESITVTGVALNLNPAKTPTYTWSADGGTISGTSSTARIDTGNAAAGNYTVKGHVSEGEGVPWNADCASSYTVRAIEPPTLTCAGNPSIVTSGNSSNITAAGVSPQGGPLTYSYSSTSGSISGSGPNATLSTTGTGPGSITVTCNVVDDKNQTASATTTVTVEVPAAAAKPVTRELCSIHFDRDARRPSRVDNEAKACLDEVALSLKSDPDAHLAIVGNASAQESGVNQLAAQRALHTREYLVGEKTIDPARIVVYTGTQDGKTVSMTLIPAGANFDMAGDTIVP